MVQHDFLPTLSFIFLIARFFGISAPGCTLAFFWTMILLIMLVSLEMGAIWKIIRLLGGWAAKTDGRGLTAQLSGSIFYGNALLSLVLSVKFITKWKNLSVYWMKVETNERLTYPPDGQMRKRALTVSAFVAFFAFVEHVLSMMSATGFDCPPEEYFQRYILSSHGFLIQPHEYNLFLAIPIFVLSKLATILWNFQDLIIILISMGLTSRYHKLNLKVNHVMRFENKFKRIPKLGSKTHVQMNIWRRIREDYVRQAALVSMVDSQLGALVLLSNINNLYFICLQLFLGLNTKSHGPLINKLYYFLSLGWLLFRAVSVVLAASDVHVHSRRALISLQTCPGTAYNIEIKRLKQQLSNDFVALSGLGLFFLDRQLLLQTRRKFIYSSLSNHFKDFINKDKVPTVVAPNNEVPERKLHFLRGGNDIKFVEAYTLQTAARYPRRNSVWYNRLILFLFVLGNVRTESGYLTSRLVICNRLASVKFSPLIFLYDICLARSLQ